MTPQVPPQLEAEVNELLTHYPPDKKRSAMVMVLHAIQNHLGCIPDEMIEWTAAKLECQPIHVYECVTFYPMLRRQPIGKYHIKICRTLSCELTGNRELAEHAKRKLGIEIGETTADRTVTLDWIECLASCGSGPCVMVNDDFYERVTKERLDQIIEPVLSATEAAVKKAAAEKAAAERAAAQKAAAEKAAAERAAAEKAAAEKAAAQRAAAQKAAAEKAAAEKAVAEKAAAEKAAAEKAVAEKAATESAPAEFELPPVEAYNRGVSFFQQGRFEEALAVFEPCLQVDEVKMLAAYGCCRCEEELEREVVLPSEFASKADEVVFLGIASNLCCYLIRKEHKAVLEPYGSPANAWDVVARIEPDSYRIRIASKSGKLTTLAWRETKGGSILVTDAGENPKPTEADQFVASLLEDLFSMSLEPLPEGGISRRASTQKQTS